MEQVHGSREASKFVRDDVISSIPDEMITNIMDRLPLQDIVRTSILSSCWRSKWTMLTQLVFDEDFYEYLYEKQLNKDFGKIINLFLSHLKGPITKFVLWKPPHMECDAKDANNWFHILSGKGIKDLTLEYVDQTRYFGLNQLSSSLGLEHLKLYSCSFDDPLWFHCFPNLLSLELRDTRIFPNDNYRALFTRYPLLERLKLGYSPPVKKSVKLVEIAKLENLKSLSLVLCELEDFTITTSSILQLMDSLPKLLELELDFRMCKLMAEAGARKRVPTSFSCLKTLTLLRLNFGSRIMLSCVYEIIRSSPNLQTLNIRVIYNEVPPNPDFSMHLDYIKMGPLHLRNVAFPFFGATKNEVCLIEYLLACSPLLKKMSMHWCPYLKFGDYNEKRTVSEKLLNFHRASPSAKVDIN